MVTLKMIAQETGLSVAAVSKALNHQPGISEKNAQIVRDCAKRLNYFPNGAAQTLKTQRSYNIGVVYQNNLDHEYYSRVLTAVRATAEAAGYDLTFLSDRGVSKYGYVAHAIRRNCDGVLVCNGNLEQEDLERLSESPIPVVSIEREFHGRTSVWGDNAASMTEIVDHVAGLGHSRIAFIHGQMGPVTAERVTAFRSACANRGIEVPDAYLRESRYQDPETTKVVTAEIMALPKPPTCILFPDDISYLGGFDHFVETGLVIGTDIGCVGYDGTNLTKHTNPRLTTYRQDAEAIGQTVVQELFSAIEKRESYKPKKIVLSGSLVPGATVPSLCA